MRHSSQDLHYIFKRFIEAGFPRIHKESVLVPLAKAIVEAHNGTIEADSTLGSAVPPLQ